LRGMEIYTAHTLEVLDTWKRDPSQRPLREVLIPGGVAGGLRQVVEGAPSLKSGQEYIIFLWTSRSGITQVIGLSQGLFRVERDFKSRAMVMQVSTGERMLDASGVPALDRAVSMKLAELKTKVIRSQKIDAQKISGQRTVAQVK